MFEFPSREQAAIGLSIDARPSVPLLEVCQIKYVQDFPYYLLPSFPLLALQRCTEATSVFLRFQFTVSGRVSLFLCAQFPFCCLANFFLPL